MEHRREARGRRQVFWSVRHADISIVRLWWRATCAHMFVCVCVCDNMATQRAQQPRPINIYKYQRQRQKPSDWRKDTNKNSVVKKNVYLTFFERSYCFCCWWCYVLSVVCMCGALAAQNIYPTFITQSSTGEDKELLQRERKRERPLLTKRTMPHASNARTRLRTM